MGIWDQNFQDNMRVLLLLGTLVEESVVGKWDEGIVDQLNQDNKSVVVLLEEEFVEAMEGKNTLDPKNQDSRLVVDKVEVGMMVAVVEILGILDQLTQNNTLVVVR